MSLRFLLLNIFLLSILLTACEPQQQSLVIGGGPSGGTYQGYAQALLQVGASVAPGMRWRVDASAGSVDNLEDLNNGSIDLALAYAGDAWLGRQGRLPEYPTPLKNVRALGRLYGAAAQLLVRDSSPIAQLSDLINTRVAIGNPGSGTALAARRYFSSLGLWDKIVPIHVGFSMGLKELDRGSVEAVWLVVGFPNQAISQEAENLPLRFIDLFSEARESGFFSNYPFYSEIIIPPGTYAGQQRRIWTFQDATLLMARLDLDPQFVYLLLQKIYSTEGRDEMQRLHPVGRELSLEHGLDNINIPLHPGATRYWREQGLR